jgi:hypothetical protein
MYVNNFIIFILQLQENRLDWNASKDEMDCRQFPRFGQDYASRLPIYYYFCTFTFVVNMLCYPVFLFGVFDIIMF